MNSIKKFCCIAMACVPFLMYAQGNGIHWSEGLTWEQVKQKAKEQNKFIFVDCYATWCGPCKAMDKDVYTAEEVGSFVNEKFLCVRLQMDITAKDSDQIKNWYLIGQQFNRQYGIEGFPSFLFFNSDGRLVHKGLGFRNVPGFIELAKDALTDPDARYAKSIEKFKIGQLDYASMPDLARNARKRKQKQLAIDIAEQFKENYLDKLDDDEAFKEQNLSFMVDFSWELMRSTDRYFKFLYANAASADSILNNKISSVEIVESIIRKEEVIDKIYRNGTPIWPQRPNWAAYKKEIKRKYGKKFNAKIFPDEQITFYAITKDWKNYIKYVNLKIKTSPPQINGKGFGPLYGDAFTLNWNAWLLFLNCTDEKYLAKAIKWADLAIKLDSSTYNANYFDTKANLLYKIGRTKDAIELQEFAATRLASNKEIAENLRKMKAGLQTWPAK